MQSDQHFCYSLIGNYKIKSSSFSGGGWFGYDLVRIPEDRFSQVPHATAHTTSGLIV